MGLAAPLAVELPEMGHAREAANAHPEAPRPLHHLGLDARVVVHVVVGIRVGGGGADQRHEPPELAIQLGRDALGLDPFELQMNPEAKSGALAGQGDRLLARLPVHHQARVSEDSVQVGLHDAAADPPGDYEIVPGDREPPHAGLPSERGGQRVSSQRP